jgi:hypothetical protein
MLFQVFQSQKSRLVKRTTFFEALWGSSLMTSARYGAYDHEYEISLERLYSVFHRFRQTEVDNSASILSASQVSLLPQLPQKISLLLKWSKLTQNNRLSNNNLNQ